MEKQGRGVSIWRVLGRLGLASIWLVAAGVVGVGCGTGTSGAGSAGQSLGSQSLRGQETLAPSRPALHAFDEGSFFRVGHDELFLRSLPLGLSYPDARFVSVEGLDGRGAMGDAVLVTAVLLAEGNVVAGKMVGQYLEHLLGEHPYLRIVVPGEDGEAAWAGETGEGAIALEDVPMIFVNGIAVHGADLWSVERAVRGQARAAHAHYVETGLKGEALYEAISQKNAAAYAEALAESRALEEGCEKMNFADCLEAGRRWAEGRQEARDWERARKIWRGLCEQGVLEGCFEEIALVARVGYGAEDEDYVGDTVQMAQASCGDGLGRACSVFALVAMGQADDETVVDAVVPALEQGCGLDDGQSCTLLGQIRLYGIGQESQYAEGVRLLEKACGLGDGEGCLHAGGATPDHLPRSRERARDHYEKACVAGAPGACGLLAELLAMGSKRSAEAAAWSRVLKMRECRDHGIGEFCAE